MSIELTHHIFLRLAGPNKGPECCLGGAGHVVVILFGVGGTPRGISFLPPKLMKINFKARKKKKPCGHPAPQLKVPPSAPYLPNNILALYLGQQALERCGESVLCSCMPAPASSGTAPASSGEVVKILRGAGFWVTMGFYGHVKSRYTFWGHLGPFPQLRQISPELATSSGNRKPRQVNRIMPKYSFWGA